jgi:hypothetical protein
MRRGPISRQGVRRRRHGRVATAWRARPGAPILHALCERMAAPRGPRRALGARARRLIGRRRACCRHGTPAAGGPAGEALAYLG